MLISTMISIIAAALIAAGFGAGLKRELSLSGRELFFIPFSALLLSPQTVYFGLSSEISAACVILPAACFAAALRKSPLKSLLPASLPCACAAGALAYIPIERGGSAIWAAALIPAAAGLLFGSGTALVSAFSAPVFSALIGLFISLNEYGAPEFVLSENAAAFGMASFLLLIPTAYLKAYIAEKRAIKPARHP